MIERLGVTKISVCGQDQINCFSIKYRGVQLMHSLKTGKGCCADGEMNGGTQITFDSNGGIKARHIPTYFSK